MTESLVLPRRLGLLAVGAVAVGPVTVIATAWRFHDELTDRLPVWWHLDQTVAATADTTVIAVLCATIGLLATLGGAVAVLAGGRLGFHTQRMVLVGLGALSGLASGLWWADMGLVLDAGPFADPEAIPAPSWDLWWPVIWLLMLALAVVLAAGAPPRVTTGRRPSPDLPRVTLPDTGPVEWWCDLYALHHTVLAGLLAIFGASSYLANPAAAMFCWALALASAAFARTRVRIDEAGVRLSPWGLPAPVLARYDTIVDARAEPVRPLRWRGRGDRLLPGAAGWLPRTRMGLVLRLADGRRFGIAMDQAEVAAGIVNSMLDRRRAAAADADAAEPAAQGERMWRRTGVSGPGSARNWGWRTRSRSPSRVTGSWRWRPAARRRRTRLGWPV